MHTHTYIYNYFVSIFHLYMKREGGEGGYIHTINFLHHQNAITHLVGYLLIKFSVKPYLCWDGERWRRMCEPGKAGVVCGKVVCVCEKVEEFS